MESREFEVATNGVLSLSIRKDGKVPWWWYLDIHGQPLYHIGNNCGTCNAIFERVKNANLPLTSQQLSERLNIGFESLPEDIFETVATLLPKGRYRAELLTVMPLFSTQENRPSSISCKADYFWICHLTETKHGADYEIILPIVDRLQLNTDKIAFYKRELENRLRPIALTFSMYDERTVRGAYYQNTFAHFLLDGHHKVMAASEMYHAISMLTFTRLNTYAESLA